jgi:hypothetical protein
LKTLDKDAKWASLEHHGVVLSIFGGFIRFAGISISEYGCAKKSGRIGS